MHVLYEDRRIVGAANITGCKVYEWNPGLATLTRDICSMKSQKDVSVCVCILSGAGGDIYLI